MSRKSYSSPDLVVYGTIASLTMDFEASDCFTAKGKLPTGEDKCGNRSRIETLDGPASGA